MAACATVAIDNPAEVSVISSRNHSQRAVLTFAAATGANSVAGHFTPGSFTNQNQAVFWEPWILVATEHRAVHQPLTTFFKVELMLTNSFNFCLIWMVFISSTFINEIFSGYHILG